MKIRDLVFLVIGGLLVISGMVLNSVLVTDAEAQDEDVTTLKSVVCEDLFIVDENGKPRGKFGLDDSGDAIFKIYGDDGKTDVAYLGKNDAHPNGEMMFLLESKSKTDKRMASMHINENGGRFDCQNKLGDSVATLSVGSKGDGHLTIMSKKGKFVGLFRGSVNCESVNIRNIKNEVAYFGRSSEGLPMLEMKNKDGKRLVYLGENKKNGMGSVIVKSGTDERASLISIDENGGRLDIANKLGASVATLSVGDKGGGVVDFRDKYGYTK